MERLPYLLIYFVPFIFSLSFHEAAHAWVANQKGDATARLMGRMTLNPLAHLDPIGTVLFPLISFLTGAPLIGWAKPVPVNERNLRTNLDGLLVAAAGPISNLILAVTFTGALFLLNRMEPAANAVQAGIDVQAPLQMMVRLGIHLNLILALFNLLPMPPLDGGRVFAGLFPGLREPLAIFERYGFIILYVLFFTHILDRLIFYPAQFAANYLMGLAA